MVRSRTHRDPIETRHLSYRAPLAFFSLTTIYINKAQIRSKRDEPQIQMANLVSTPWEKSKFMLQFVTNCNMNKRTAAWAIGDAEMSSDQM